ncbi:MAG: hypothetical protein HYW62_01775 [Candidatus Levybacteria bacterium]|nr:hypothetical protein [Candidatus Levybacteria bacterium]
MKELAAGWVQRRALDSWSDYLLDCEDQLTASGEINFQIMAERIKKGKQTPLSEYIGVLNGFKLSSEGSSFLEGLKGTGTLFLENHTIQGPINGSWKLFATNYLIKKMTGKEIRWISGQNKSTTQRFFRHPIIESHRAILNRGNPIGKSANSIPVGEGNGTKGIKLILKAFSDQESVGLYPEGEEHRELIRGDPKAGGIILFAARKNIPIISTSAWFGENTCYLSFTLLDNEFIEALGTSPGRENNKQDIVDYAMAEIAQNMPRELRGYYQDFYVPIPANPAK